MPNEESGKTTLQRFKVIVQPETERGTRSVVVREGRQNNVEGPIEIRTGERVTAEIEVKATERENGATVTVDTDLLPEEVSVDV